MTVTKLCFFVYCWVHAFQLRANLHLIEMYHVWFGFVVMRQTEWIIQWSVYLKPCIHALRSFIRHVEEWQRNVFSTSNSLQWISFKKFHGWIWNCEQSHRGRDYYNGTFKRLLNIKQFSSSINYTNEQMKTNPSNT